MSDIEAKEMEEDREQSPRGSESGEPEQKLELSEDLSNEAEDIHTIDMISDDLQQVGFGALSLRAPASHIEKTGQKTIEQWLTRDNLVVYPVWIGNLPRETSVPDLRKFLEAEIGRVLISVHISPKRNSNERTYAFLNLPTAEKQILAVTLLDGTIFQGEKLIVRSKRPSKFPQSFFGSSPISDHFKHFRDCVVPAILAAPTVNLNVHAVKRIMEEHNVGLDHLPNRVWCVQCTLTPNCHRTYCSFYHNQEERELGRIISILAAQNCNDSSETTSGFDATPNENGDLLKRPVAVSRHTLLIEGLPKSVSTQKLTEMFEVFGEIDHVIVNPNNTCFLRMKRSQDARKIVHLLNMNNSGIQIQFAPYAANPHLMSALRSASAAKRSRTDSHGRSYARSSRGSGGLSLGDRAHDWSHDSVDTDITAVSGPSMGAQHFGSGSGGHVTGGGYAGHQATGPPRRRHHHHPHHRGSAGAHPGYTSVMPRAPPPPAALFKEDDMASYMQRPRQQYPEVSTPGGYNYGDDRSGMMDYHRYGMVMNVGYGTPTASEWGSSGMYNGYPPSYGGYYPYHNPSLPQMSHISASDPSGYHHPSHAFAGGYQAPHPGYQHDQPVRHSRRGRRHLDAHAHSSHAFAQRAVGEQGHSSRHPVPGQVPQSAPPQKKKVRSGSLTSDPALVQGMLDDIPGI